MRHRSFCLAWGGISKNHSRSLTKSTKSRMELKRRSCEIDWATLPPDLINLISTKFTEASDLVRFRAVCKNWQSCSLDNTPKFLPWLLKSFYPEPDSGFVFFSSTLRPQTFDIPDIVCRESLLRSSCDGYLVAYDSRTTSPFLLNPLTRRKIYLPPLKLGFCNPIHIGKEKIVIIGSNDDTTKSKMLAHMAPGDSEWTTIEDRYESYGHLYHDNKYYICHHDGCIDITDHTVDNLLSRIRPRCTTSRPAICASRGGDKHLVALNDEIFQVYRAHDDRVPTQQCYFDIHRLEPDGTSGGFRWERVSDIGDNILFVDSVRILALKASDFEGYKGNSIYFVKFEFVDWEWSCLLCRYDIGEERVEVLPSSIEYGNTWFMPRLE